MKRLVNAVIYGSAMFCTSFVIAATCGAIYTIYDGLNFEKELVLFFLRKAFISGAVAGVACFLIAYFGAHRRIRSK